LSSLLELMNPAQVCQALGITPNGVRRLSREGYLEVKDMVRFKNGDMSLFSIKQVHSLLPVMPRIKQAWETHDKSRFGARRVSKAHVHRHKSYNNQINHKEEFFMATNALAEKTAQLIKACYYLFHLNHYAKAGNQYLYDLKELVLQTFVEQYTSDDLVKVSFIEGDNKVLLCPGCKARAKERGMSYLEYLDAEGACPRCTREYKYYSLYEFIISYDEYRFCFHTPYSTAKKWFKNIGLRPPQTHKPQREGAYTFGRSVYESEAQVVELIEVIEELQNFLANFGVEALIETGIRGFCE